MHRDGELRLEMFEGVEGARAKILIYEKTLDWVLTKQRPDWLNRQLTAMETEGLRRILAEAALCVVQSGGECAAMEMVKERIQDNDSAARLIEQAQDRLGDDALKNALAAFYLQPAKADKGGSVEFAHKSFSEFLFAQRLKECLEEWTEQGRRGEEFLVKNAQMAWEIYDLLGYGGLTLEIVEYLMGLLTTSDEFRPVQLFNRLENFYLRWCDGEFIDALQDNYPQKKMSQLQGQGIHLGVRYVDIYAGLNVMILLLELNRYAQSRDDLKGKIAFHACGKKDTESFDKDRLLRIIGYSQYLSVDNFILTVGLFLSCINLKGINLSHVNLWGVDLGGADFSDASLYRASFIEANLKGANFSHADLSFAAFNISDLSEANLNKADLGGTSFNETNLTGANLSDTELLGTDLSDANLKDIYWNEMTNWDFVEGLESAKNVPDALKQQLGLE
jgi:hypothetical protein